MNAAVTAATTWFPLVPRPRPPCLSLNRRIAELSTLAARPDEGTGQERVTRATAVLNNAALIASDCGVPELARALCHRQYELFARSAPLPGWAVKLALQPVLNIARQLIRNGHYDDARTMLHALHHAAVHRTALATGVTRVDFATLTSTTDGHREARTITWTAMLADGTRALAAAGRWKEAAEHAAAHRGTGARLLDGRQALILALLADGQPLQARELVEQATVTEPWEHAVQAILRVLCQRDTGQIPEPEARAMTTAVRELTETQDPPTAVSRTRIGLTALDLLGETGIVQAFPLREALIVTGRTDACAARDLLASNRLRQALTGTQRSALQTFVRSSGLGAGSIPWHLHTQLTEAAHWAEAALQRNEVHYANARQE